MNILEIVTLLTGAYEIVSRSIKTTKTWSIIGNALHVLSAVSKTLDRKKK